ncbi:peptidoglycan DD-metalloendopeptidase family protein [candidate division KSB1 bacterium]|jgi:murein DD-endopeptidase MepM/ murein hydrolase activator NlpD|nr:peptidoglycan DD-metalloendopeptidase family protein [candidate division KSB1 bacterium]
MFVYFRNIDRFLRIKDTIQQIIAHRSEQLRQAGNRNDRTKEERNMRNKQIKLIYFSYGGSDVKQISLGWKNIVGFAVATFTILLFFVSVMIGLFTDFYHNWQVNHLNKTNGQLLVFLDEMTEKVKTLQQQVSVLEKEDNDLRVFVDLPQIDSDVRKLGVGGHDQFTINDFSSISDDTRNSALKVKGILDNLERRIQVAQESREEILQKYAQDLKQIKHTPSIRPVVQGRYTDRFGPRIDPLIEQIRPHYGLDISAPRGTPVYATADGVVTDVVERYKPNVGYGKMVEVDHGYGLVTKYAHLHKILVKKGQKITRHTIVGQVGDTGRSTGPHLHYEVVLEGKHKDPENFILN